MQVEDLDLTPIVSAGDYPVVVHGTNRKAWDLIKKSDVGSGLIIKLGHSIYSTTSLRA